LYILIFTFFNSRWEYGRFWTQLSIFCCLGHLSKDAVQAWGSVNCFITSVFYGEGLLAPTPKEENHPFSFGCGCLFSVFSATLHCWRPSLSLQPKDAPSCGDKETHLTWFCL
jgi:hypothetical protein